MPRRLPLPRSRSRPWPLAALLAACASACAAHEERRLPHVNVSPEEVALPASSLASRGVDLGLEVAANESDSLDALETLPGVRVLRAATGGAAAQAGIGAGDVILSVGGVTTDDRDAFETAVSTAAPGEPVRLEVRRDTTVFALELAGAAPSGGGGAVELCRADPLRLCAGFRSAVVECARGRVTGAEVVRIDDRSPLPAAGVGPGDVITALDGVPIASAQDLVRRLVEEREPGASVRLWLARGGAEREVEVELWAPPRRLTRFSIPILFDYETRRDPERTRVAILDFWLFSLFSWERRGSEREWRVLSLFRFASGEGELTDETGAGGR